ncbi:RagB/SusD family nutrient uptake outer membrane protein [Hymenobacter sp. YC55]|uniref:RagB/SusD family nutrient uptake outer membrane protein n=1 Tax=Hymenobacter sp. YC55 TaxID=3034019 RepID=UPI0023F985F5|nr:RagB/SusD family nutrient uptake outer membrane protein [Hymenobacter sp. YC55]MDF7814186.1 RagB/SusD family nutrient uptake outer membrane protein [Hymenobacter sp. YC55]
MFRADNQKLDERAREFAGESKRWLDLQRTHWLQRAVEQNNPTNSALEGAALDK